MLAIYTSYCSQEVLQPAGRNWSISGIEAPLAGNFLFPIVRIDDKHLEPSNSANGMSFSVVA